MYKNIPISVMKNTTLVLDLCRKTKEPINISKNGQTAMVIMDATLFQEKKELLEKLIKKCEAYEKETIVIDDK